MQIAKLPENELERLSALYAYNVLDSLSEQEFDDITRIASYICECPMSVITLIDADRQWFKSAHGIGGSETPRDVAFCAHAILNPHELMEVPDAQKDARFADNPLVTGDPHVMFYAGVPLLTDNGLPLGSLCVIDQKPKALSEEQRISLRALGNQVSRLLELRKKAAALDKKQQELDQVNEELEQYAYVIAQDAQSPCNELISVSETLSRQYAGQLDPEARQMLYYLRHASEKVKHFVEEVLQYARTTNNTKEAKERFSFSQLMEELQIIVPAPSHISFSYKKDDKVIYAVKPALTQVFLYLLETAFRNNRRDFGFLDIHFAKDEKHYRFTVSDNGTGLRQPQQGSILDMFKAASNGYLQQDTDDLGIVLKTVEKLVAKMGGKVSYHTDGDEIVSLSFTVLK